MKIINYTFPMINKRQAGFTLLETLVAVFILTIALNSLFSLVANSLFSSQYAKNEITATYLAQEAVDYIRNNRDTEAFQHLGGGTWTSFLGNYGYDQASCFSSDGCYLDASNPDPTASVQACTSSGCPVFLYDADPVANNRMSYFTYNTEINAVPTIFKRTIKLSLNPSVPSLVSTDPDNELDIVVTVEWKNGSVSLSRVLQASLLKWQ
jgi:prepilin-type N-terminal cleavage/methylation domain-containing protein